LGDGSEPVATFTLLFCVAFIAGAFLALGKHPIFGLVTYVGVFYLSPADRWWGEGLLAEIRWGLLAAGLTVASIVIHRRKLKPLQFWGRGPVVAIMLFTGWLAIQSMWALDQKSHFFLLEMYAKFIIAMLMIFRCIETVAHLKLFLWTHVLGCLYFGLIAYTKHIGGRFGGFGGPGLDDANSGALALATGVIVAASLFLAGTLRQRVSVTLAMPFILNGLVATMSRSGFLAVAIGGAIFNFFAPARVRPWVRWLSVAGLILLLLVTSPAYWARMATIKYAGQEIEDVDTGGGRKETLIAQWQMFRDHPFGCGHRCTATLSRHYLEDRFLTGNAENRARASHNTFMSLLVEQGIPGALFYVAMLYWMNTSLQKLWRRYKSVENEEASLFPAVFGVLAAVTAGDLFVDFLRFEIRFWFIVIVMLLLAMPERRPVVAREELGAAGHASVQGLRAGQRLSRG
jgi:O-antigen ligase